MINRKQDFNKKEFSRKRKCFLAVVITVFSIVILTISVFYLLKQSVSTKKEIVAVPEIKDSVLVILEDKLSGWVLRWQKTIPNFNLGLLKRESETKIDFDTIPFSLYYDPNDREELKLRKRYGYIYYSPDKSKFVDLDVYAYFSIENGDTAIYGESDQLVVLFDLKKQASVRIAFFGTISGAGDVLWLDNNTFVITGSTEGHTKNDEIVHLPTLTFYKLIENKKIVVLDYILENGLDKGQ